MLPFVLGLSEGLTRESCEALREGGPTKRVGAGRRLAFVLEVGEGFVGEVMPGTLVVDMMGCCYILGEGGMERSEVSCCSKRKDVVEAESDGGIYIQQAAMPFEYLTTLFF